MSIYLLVLFLIQNYECHGLENQGRYGNPFRIYYKNYQDSLTRNIDDSREENQPINCDIADPIISLLRDTGYFFGRILTKDGRNVCGLFNPISIKPWAREIWACDYDESKPAPSTQSFNFTLVTYFKSKHNGCYSAGVTITGQIGSKLEGCYVFHDSDISSEGVPDSCPLSILCHPMDVPIYNKLVYLHPVYSGDPNIYGEIGAGYVLSKFSLEEYLNMDVPPTGFRVCDYGSSSPILTTFVKPILYTN